MEYFIPTKRQSPILPLLQMRQYMQRPQQHQNPFAQFLGMRQPNALSQYPQPEAGFNPGMAWWMRQRLQGQGRRGADMLPFLWTMRQQQQGGGPSDDPWRF